MEARLELRPHPTGPWLLRVGEARFALPGPIGRALAPLHGSSPAEAEIREHLEAVAPPEVTGPWSVFLARLLAGHGARRSGRALRWRVPLIPASLVVRLAGRLRPLTSARGLTALALAGSMGYLSTMAGTGPTGPAPTINIVVAGLGLFLLSALGHEWGHAAAVARSGYPPGGIGAGLLFVIPVLWADVTPVAALPRRRRLRVELAGVCFQLGAGGLCAVLAATDGPGTAVFGMGAAGALAAVSWSLLPFMRTAGYWALCDFLGLEDRDRPPPAGSSRLLSWFCALFRVANGLFLCFVLVWSPQRIFGLTLGVAGLAGFEPGNPAVRGFAVLATMAVFGGLAWRAWRRLRRLIFP